MIATILFSLLLAPETPPVQIAANEVEAVAVAEPEADEPDADAVPAGKKICRRSSVQRGVGLITQSRKVCRTAAEWKAAGGR